MGNIIDGINDKFRNNHNIYGNIRNITIGSIKTKVSIVLKHNFYVDKINKISDEVILKFVDSRVRIYAKITDIKISKTSVLVLSVDTTSLISFQNINRLVTIKL